MSESTFETSACPTWTFGRSRQCDFVIDATAVSHRHGTLTRTEHGFVIADAGSTNGIYVNGHRINRPTAVSAIDQVTLGTKTPFPWEQFQLQLIQKHAPVVTPFGSSIVDDAPDADSERQQPAPEQRISANIPFPESPNPAAIILEVGRDPSCDFVIDEGTVSWRHARLVWDGKRATIEDLSSANGIAIDHPQSQVRTASLEPENQVYFGSHAVRAAELIDAAKRIEQERVGTHSYRTPNTPPLTESRDNAGPLKDSESHVSFPMGPVKNYGATVELPYEEIDFRRPPVQLDLGTHPLILGRDPQCDHVLDHPMVSWRHAKVARRDGEVWVEDLGSRNGTYINGERIQRMQVVAEGDVLALGSFTISLQQADNDLSLLAQDRRGELTVEARNVTVDVGKKRLIENVSLTIHPGEFVALMGPSGSGKSTLMNALNGYTVPSSGAVFADNMNLHEHFDLFRGQIGYVPQDDVMHRRLTVGQALYFTARLRFPPDHSDQEIRRRINEVLSQLGLQGTEDTVIGSPETKGISGGQRKRVNLAMELLTDPAVLFLDEPTSGLSSEDALMVMRVLRGLADRGKTILMTIHQPSLDAFRMTDLLVTISRNVSSIHPGRLVYFGPAYPQSIHFFNPHRQSGSQDERIPQPDEILRGLAKKPTSHWTKQYERSSYRDEFVTQRQGRITSPHAESRSRPKIELGLRQAWTLLRRNVALKRSDPSSWVLLLLQAPVIAVLIAIVLGPDSSQKIDSQTWQDVSKATATTMFLLVLSSLWCGCSNAVREIVGEWAVYRRERMVNLKIPSYLLAKLAILSGLSGVQTLMLLGITHPACGLSGSFLILLAVLWLTSIVGVSIGLFVSALAPTSEFAVASLPLIVLPMVMLGGVLQPLPNMSRTARTIAAGNPARWAFEGSFLVESNQKPVWDPAWSPSVSTSPSLPDDDSQGQVEESISPQQGGPVAERDMAELLFPKEDFRVPISQCVITLFAMLLVLTTAVGAVLKLRDIH